MKFNIVRAAFGAALVSTVFAAQAVPFGLTGYSNGSVAALGSTPSFNTNAGGFVGTLSGAGALDANPFYTYSVELVQDFIFDSSLTGYTIVDGATYFGTANLVLASGSTIATRLGKLFTVLGGVGLPVDANTSAAIQLAVWESVYERNIPLTLISGSFSATSAADAVANSLLSSAAAVMTSLYSISVLANSDHTDFVLVQRVPEPASLALVSLALAGLAAARRRRA